MKRWAFHILAGLSLVLFVGFTSLWIRSHWRGDVIGWERASTTDASQRGGTVSLVSGSVSVTYWTRGYVGRPAPVRESGFIHFDVSPTASGAWRQQLRSMGARELAGFAVHRFDADLASPRSDGRPSSWSIPQTTWALLLPMWSLAALAALPPGAWLWRRLRRRSRAKGFEVELPQ